MSAQDLFERVLGALNEAVLDDARWAHASALIDEACGTRGNILVSGEGGLGTDLEVYFARCCYRGERHPDFEREYFGVYHHVDERGPRLRRLPDSQIVHVGQLYTEAEKRGSVTYNEALARSHTADALHARLDGPHGSRIIWTAADPVDDAGWSAERVETLARLLPHIRQYVRVRLALVDAQARGATLARLLDHTRCGVVELDARGRIVATNDRAHTLLRRRDGLSDAKGALRAVVPREDAALQRLLARALSRFGAAPESASMTLTRAHGVSPQLVLHVHPVSPAREDERASRVGAVVLVVEAQARVAAPDPRLVASALGLTPAESRVAVMLAQGHTLRDIAAASGRSAGTVRWHLNGVFAKVGVSRQAELVSLVQSLAAMTPDAD